MNYRFWSLNDGRVVPASGYIDGKEYRGSMYLWRRLRTAVSSATFRLDAGCLSTLTEDQFRQAFADDYGACPLEPGLEDRVANLNDLGAGLIERWDGQFVNLIDAADGSLEAFATLSAQFRAFDDPVRKLTMVNAIMLVGSGLASFSDDPLPGIDYHLMKHALRQGLVVPDEEISEKLVNGKLLDSAESLAIRQAVLAALIRVANEAQISTAVLDNLYWTNRQICCDPLPSCSAGCPFEEACVKRTSIGMPVEMTRYY
jgi:hypothetical protein